VTVARIPVLLQVVLLAAACAGTAGALGLLVVRLRPRRSVRAALVQVAALAVACVVAGAARAMFISGHDLRVVLQVTVVATAVALAVAALTGQAVVRDVDVVRRRAQRVGDTDRETDSDREAHSDRDTGHRPVPALVELAEIDDTLRTAALRLAEGRQRERALEASRRELVAWVSHDLRTPLAGLRAMAEALEDGVAADPDRYHKQIALEVERLSRMVDDLFELSRIQAGSLVVEQAPLDLRDVVHGAVLGGQARARAAATDLSLDAGDAPVVVTGDARSLARAVGNLLDNAIRYGGTEGAIRVSLTLADPSAPPGSAVVRVEDSCGGIPEPDLARLFEPGWRATPSRTPSDDGGAGLGTAIARGIALAHGGDVTVVNAGAGCRFELTVPLRPGR